MGGTTNLLGKRWPLLLLDFRKFDHLSTARGLLYRFYNANIRHSFFTGGLGLPVFKNTIGEVNKFGGKLVSFRKGALARTSGNLHFDVDAFSEIQWMCDDSREGRKLSLRRKSARFIHTNRSTNSTGTLFSIRKEQGQ